MSSKVLLKMSDEKYAGIVKLQKECGFKTEQDMFIAALSLLDWAATQIETGRTIASMNLKEESIRRLKMPFFTVITERQNHKKNLPKATEIMKETKFKFTQQYFLLDSSLNERLVDPVILTRIYINIKGRVFRIDINDNNNTNAIYQSGQRKDVRTFDLICVVSIGMNNQYPDYCVENPGDLGIISVKGMVALNDGSCVLSCEHSGGQNIKPGDIFGEYYELSVSKIQVPDVNVKPSTKEKT